MRHLRTSRLAPVVLFLLVAAAVVGWHMHKYPYLSPIDENTQYDYVRVLPHIPSGVMSQDSLRLTACRKYAPDLFDRGLAKWPWPSCTSRHFDPAAFPGGGQSTAGSTAPFYYVVTAVLTRPVAGLFGLPLFSLIRASNVLWLTALMSLCHLVARRLRVSKAGAMGAAVLVGTASDTVTSASTVGPDTATAVTGGLVILAALAYDRSRRSTLLLLAAVTIASVTKLTDFTAVGAAMLILVVRFLTEGEERTRRAALRTAAVAAGSGLIFVALSLAWYLRPTSAAATPVVPDVVVPWGTLKTQLFFNFLTPDVGNFNAAFMVSPFNNHLQQILASLMTVGILVSALAFRRAPRASALGWGVAVMTLVGPVLLTLLNQKAYNNFMPLPPRYGDGILVGFAAATAWMLRGKAGTRALVVLAVISFLNVFL